MSRCIRGEIPWWRLERLARALGVWTPEPVMFIGRRGKIEYMIHEVAHAVSLRLPLTCGVQEAISESLHRRTKRVRFMQRAEGIENEALCLAAELAVLPRLGIAVAYSDLADAAAIQRVPAHTLSRALRSRAAKRLAERVMFALSEAA